MNADAQSSEDVLDSADAGLKGPGRRWLRITLVCLALLGGLLAFQALAPDPVPELDGSAGRIETSAAEPSLVDASARRLYGDSAITGAQTFSTAVRAANAVVEIYCRPDVPSWSATLITSDDSYDQATFLMSPANRRYGTFVVQVELSWEVDRYSFAVIAGHVERCL